MQEWEGPDGTGGKRQPSTGAEEAVLFDGNIMNDDGDRVRMARKQVRSHIHTTSIQQSSLLEDVVVFDGDRTYDGSRVRMARNRVHSSSAMTMAGCLLHETRYVQQEA